MHHIIILFVIIVSEYSSFAKTFLNFKLIFPSLLILLFLIGFGSETFTGIIENAFLGFLTIIIVKIVKA